MKKLLLLAIMCLMTLSVSAHFSIHSSTKGVEVESGGSKKAAVKGTAVKATDYIIIPAGGEVEIYNDVDKRIYRSVNTGKMSVTRLMMDAKKLASDNNKTVGSRLNIAGGKKDNGSRVYNETGMVTRDIAVAGSEKTLPKVAHGDIEGNGLYFKVTDTLDIPIYCNVYAVTSADNDPEVEISPLGQNEGFYRIAPAQTLTLENPTALPACYSAHYLVISANTLDNEDMKANLKSAIEADNEISADAMAEKYNVYIIKL